MSQVKKIKEEIVSNNNYKLLTRAYQEHAVAQMNSAKFSVFASRKFSDDLEEIFANVKTSYKNYVFGKRMKNVVKKNGKQAWILVTANKKLYGDLLIKICNLFMENLKNTDPNKIDLIIIGREGKRFFDEQNTKRPYAYYELSEFKISLDFLKDVNKNLIYYEDVIVYYGKFNNLVNQTPIQTSIAGGLPDEPAKDVPKEPKEAPARNASQSDAGGKKHSFIFEPSVLEILAFFEDQVLSILLNQVVQESILARFASRIDAMEQAQQNIEKQLKILVRHERVVTNMDTNRKQLELLTGRKLWKH